MCESEFLLVKQAAAIRLGVSLDRLRIKYEQHRFEDEELLFSLFFVTNLLQDATPGSGVPIIIDSLSIYTLSNIGYSGFFLQQISSSSVCLVSGYSFEIV